jgi:alpha-1,2-mannosyltransferase
VLYDYLEPKSTYGFTYPPFAAIAMLPMAVTPWPVTVVVNATACVAATVVLLYWLVDPVARRQGWPRWFALGVALCLAAAFEPLRETFLFGQANMLLVFLVAADLLLLVGRGSRFAGVGIGLATAIKLTPGIFLIYLLVTRRWRAALVAAGTATAATVLAAAVAPDVSQVFWTDALWNTDRVGQLAFISNQSLNGAVARLDPLDPSTALWLLAVLAVLVVWVARVRRAGAAGDEAAGFALTGVVGCLVSPVTWVHHLVWVGPALVLLLDRAVATPDPRRRRRLLIFLGVSYALLCSRIVWAFGENWWANPVGWLLSNSYVWISLALLVALPVRPRPTVPPAADRLTLRRTAADERELAALGPKM